MAGETFQPFDLHRIFLGDAPLLFLAEIVFRTFLMYAYTVFLLRVLGKRGMGQLSTLELAIIICFGSAVGDPMIGQDMPIIYGVVAITTVALLQLGLERVINKNVGLEQVVEGIPNCLVDNGRIIVGALAKDNISHADLFRALRSKDVQHLGEVNKAFFETSGQITVIYNPPKKVKPGLSLMPEEELPEGTIQFAPFEAVAGKRYYCMNCGYSIKPQHQVTIDNCTVCDCNKWQADMD